ncbi:MAG: hypothetical protein E4G96_01335 [Chrysiogenales bacterium]|nr:MAG: hypothetical protein E4G96_01335 [Chrysiogenales bacterium]
MRPIQKALPFIPALLLRGALPLRADEWSGLAEAADSFGRITEFLQGVHSFLSGISFISETIGFPTLFLFLAIILLSAGFTAMGVPKGKPSFLASLFTADCIWALWNISLQARFGEYIGSMIRSNLILLAPAATVSIVARIAPLLTARARRAGVGLFQKKKSLDRDAAVKLLEDYQEKSSGLGASLLSDILAASVDPIVRFSDATKERARALEELLDRLGETDVK